MPKYVVGTLLEMDVFKVADLMRRLGASILGLNTITDSRRTSGRISLECTEELAERLKKIDGVKYFEEAISHYPISR